MSNRKSEKIEWHFKGLEELDDFLRTITEPHNAPNRLYLAREVAKYKVVKGLFEANNAKEFPSRFLGFYKVPRGVKREDGEESFWHKLFHEDYGDYVGLGVHEMREKLNELFKKGSKQFSFVTKMIALHAEAHAERDGKQVDKKLYPLYDRNIAALCGFDARQMTDTDTFCEFYIGFTEACRRIISGGNYKESFINFKAAILGEGLTDMRALDFACWYLGGAKLAEQELNKMKGFSGNK